MRSRNITFWRIYVDSSTTNHDLTREDTDELTLEVGAGAKAEAEAKRAMVQAAVNFMVVFNKGKIKRLYTTLMVERSFYKEPSLHGKHTRTKERYFPGSLRKSQVEVVSSLTTH
jgi:hypothetical protein